MPTTTEPYKLIRELVQSISKMIEDGTRQGYRIVWDAFLPIIIQNWGWILFTLFIIFTFVSIKAFTGQWGSLGSFLYNLFYFGTLFIIGLMWGPEIFVGDLFNFACAVILYPICYSLSGFVMRKMGVRGKGI